MTNSKRLLVMLACFIASVSIQAQEKELVVKYKTVQKEIDFMSGTYKAGDPNETQVFAYGNRVISRRFTGMGHENLTIENMHSATLDSIYNNYTMLDYTKGQLFTIMRARSNKILITESLPLFNWKLDRESKTILNYLCTKATCSFRGRNYIAYLTRELPFKAAPWKFHGLPGVVLEVYSTDGFCKWTAQSLVVKPHGKKIKPPFDGIDKVDLNQYITILKKVRKDQLEHQKKMAVKSKALGHKLFFPPDPMKVPNRIEIFDLE